MVYIDEIILVPIGSALPQNVLETFNSVNKSISFTLKAPDQDNILNLLDIAIEIK